MGFMSCLLMHHGPGNKSFSLPDVHSLSSWVPVGNPQKPWNFKLAPMAPSHTKWPQGHPENMTKVSIMSAEYHSGGKRLEWFPYENLVSNFRSQDFNYNSVHKMTWRARTKSIIELIWTQTAFKMGSRNHANITRNCVLGSHVSLTLLPWFPRVPTRCQNVSQGAKTDAPGLLNDSFRQPQGAKRGRWQRAQPFI